MTKNRELSFDGIKGLSCLIIACVWHYRHFGVRGDISPLYNVFEVSYANGDLLVELFFMLSGIGMMIGYKNKIQSQNLLFKDFAVKRVQKLYPLHLLTLLLVIPFQIMHLNATGNTFVYKNFDVYHFILNFLGLQNGFFGTEWSFNSPSWCISIFLMLYALFYLLIYKSKSDTSIAVKFSIAAIIGIGILIAHINYPVLNPLTARGLASFSVGVLVYYAYENKHKLNYLAIGIVMLIFWVFVYILIRTTNLSFIGSKLNLDLFLILLVYPAFILSVLFIKPLNKLFSLKPLVYLGKISMSVYLLHFPIQLIIRVIDIYFNLNIDYTNIFFYLIYITIVLFFAIIYSDFISEPFEKCFGLLLKPTKKVED